MKPKANDVPATQQTPVVTTGKPVSIKRPMQGPAKRPGARIGRKMVIALKAIVWEGQELHEAAVTAKLTTFQVRQALSRPHVIQWVKQEREVFRAHVSAQNIHRAKQLRDTSGNAMAQLGAMKFIEQIGDDPQASGGMSKTPGFAILIVNGAGSVEKALNMPAQTIDLQVNTGKGTPFGGEHRTEGDDDDA